MIEKSKLNLSLTKSLPCHESILLRVVTILENGELRMEN